MRWRREDRGAGASPCESIVASSQARRLSGAGDRGPEYRNLVGIPGGIKSPLAQALVQASIRQGDKLDFATGKGDDGDIRATAFVMDSTAFPFFNGEPYHQFHDGARTGSLRALRPASPSCNAPRLPRGPT